MTKDPPPGWTYVLLEGYCFFKSYSNRKRTKVYSYEGNDFMRGKRTESIVKNDFYLPKHLLKRPKGCPHFPGSHCLEMKCRFFAWCDGYFSDMTGKMLKNYRRRDKMRKKSDMQRLIVEAKRRNKKR